MPDSANNESLKTSINVGFIFAIIFLALIFMSWKVASASVRIGILPYKIIAPHYHAYSYIKNSIPIIIGSNLASDNIFIARNSDIIPYIKKNHIDFSTKSLIKLSDHFNIDYLIYGRIVKIGDTFVIQTNIFNIHKRSIVYRKTVQVLGTKFIIKDMNNLSFILKKRILSLSRVATVKNNTNTAKSPHVSRVQNSVFMKSFSQNSKGLVTTRTMDFLMHTLVTGRFLSKGIQTVVATNNRVILYNLSMDGKLTKIGQYNLSLRSNVIYLGFLKISANSNAIVLTKAKLGTITSYLLVYRNGKLLKLTGDYNLFLRVMSIGNARNILVGQEPIAVTASGRYFGAVGQNSYPIGQFGGSTYIYKFNKDTNALIRTQKLPIYNDITLYGTVYGNIKGSGEDYLLALSNSGNLMLINSKGKTIYMGSKTYGGSPLQVSVSSSNGANSATYADSLIYNIPTRLTKFYKTGNEKLQVVVLKNYGQIRFMRNLNYYTKSSIYSIAWNNIGFYPVWEIKPIAGYSAGFSIFRINKSVYLADGIVKNPGSVFTKPKSCIVIYKIEN